MWYKGVEMCKKYSEQTSMIYLLIVILMSGLITFMYYPFMSLAFFEKNSSLSATGLLVGIMTGVGSCVSFLSGYVIRTVGIKNFSIALIVIRIFGLSVFLIPYNFFVYCMGCAMTSIGGSLLNVCIKSELLKRKSSRKIISLRTVCFNFGALIGPTVGGILYHFMDFASIVITSCILLLVTCVFTCVGLSVGTHSSTSAEEIKEKNFTISNFMYLFIISIFWMIYSQWATFVPLYVKSVTGSDSSTSVIFSINALLIFLFQYPVLTRFLRKWENCKILLLGYVIFLLAFMNVFADLGIFSLVVFAFCFSLGEMIVIPSLDELLLDTCSKNKLNFILGFSGTASGIGSFTGASLGGKILSQANNSGIAIWGMTLSFVSILLIFLYKKTSARLCTNILD